MSEMQFRDIKTDRAYMIMDNPMAMMYDIFEVAGRAFIEEA